MMYPRLKITEPSLPGWTVDEDLYLLEGLMFHGLGNWELVRHHVDPLHYTKTVLDCVERFSRLYGPGGPFAIGEDIPVPDTRAKDELEAMFGREIDLSTCLGAPLPIEPDVTAKPDEMEVPDIIKEEPRSTGGVATRSGAKGDPHPPAPRLPVPTTVHGYMPLRNEFAIEFDDQAEDSIAAMTIDACKDTLCSTNTKIVILNLFVERLKIRAEKKAIVLAGGLTERAALDNMRRFVATGSKELLVPMDKITPFFRYGDAEHPFTGLVDGLVEESRLRTEIARLQDWRVHGLTKKSEGIAYDSEMNRRTSKTKAKPKPRKGAARPGGKRAKAQAD